MSVRTPVALLGEMVPTVPSEFDDEIAARIAELGFIGVGLHLGSGSAGGPTEVDSTACRHVRSVLEEHGLRVFHSWAFGVNLVRESERHTELGRLAEAFRVAAELGADAVIGGCGSLAATGGYSPSPGNWSEAATGALVEALEGAASLAEAHGVVLALECHVLTTLDTPERARAIIDEVGSDWIRVNIDPVNLIPDVRSLYDSRSLIDRVLDALAPVAVSGHVKDARADDDFVVHISEAPLGDGVFDVAAFVEGFTRRLPGMPLFLEHLPTALVPRSKERLDGILALSAHGAS